MTAFNIVIKSKNKNVLNSFVLFLSKYLTLGLKNVKKKFQAKTKIKRLVLLKSPHVNKKAQEHFESKLLKKQLLIKLQKCSIFVVFLKKISNKTFPLINIQFKKIFKNSSNIFWNIFSVNNFKIKTQKKIFLFVNLKLKKTLSHFSENLRLKKPYLKKNSKLFDLLSFSFNSLKLFYV